MLVPTLAIATKYAASVVEFNHLLDYLVGLFVNNTSIPETIQCKLHTLWAPAGVLPAICLFSPEIGLLNHAQQLYYLDFDGDLANGSGSP